MKFTDLGTGTTGAAIATKLRGHGFDTMVWDRTVRPGPSRQGRVAAWIWDCATGFIS
jgi:3-hydroxyisobutyrate dehydrogenase-like beta-hydroxyacid dehydrogenase